MFPHKHLILVSGIALGYLCMRIFAVTRLPQDEVEVLNQIVKTMGANWTFGSDACEDYVDIKPVLLMDPRRNITCDCGFENNTCHIISLKILLFSLPGTLPTELVRLPYLQEIDFAYNYLSGPIPSKWAFLQLTYISLFGNRLSGNIPSFLGNITGLKYLDLEVNQFSGSVPSELGKLVHLETLRLSSNRLSGNLPMELAELKNLTDFRINDNNFNGSIPEYIKNWKQLQRIEILGSGLDGPIPPSIFGLENVIQLKISDIAGTGQTFPELRNMSNIRRIILKNCSISGEIPEYIWGLNNLRLLDVSFNKLTGELPYVHIYGPFKFIFLSSNFLSGNIPKSILKKGSNVDLSYNNFTWESVEQSACLEKPNLNLNLFRSSTVEKNISGALPCMDNFKCQWYRHSLYINCGGETVKINGKTFEGDAGVGGGAATFYFNANTNWGFSSTGDFMDDDDEQNTNYIANLQSSQISELYTNARIAPTLSYIGYCLENGSYTVSLHFAEIQFTNDKTYRSLGRRKFDIYVKDKLVEKDFDIEAAASGILKPVIKEYKANVTNNILEIHFIWAGKGTTAIPKAGVYGPLISAISVDPNFKPHYGEEKREILPVVISVGAVGFFTIFLAFGILCWRYFRTKSGRERDFKGLDDLHTSYFTLKQIKAATNNFDSANKIGEGGFGPVYKGQLSDGTTIAVKQLSSKSKQGNREFLNELGMISCLQHPNLVKLYGCCIEGDQLLLIYEYMENNSLARALFGHEKCQLKLDWPTRQKICLGVAKGLAYLHEESRFKIVHRDIKATNVLLDRDLNPKISDFGLAKLYEEEKTHISTRIAGTIGYMAPEYALWGYLTYKADVYSFGVVALEIVSGKNNMNYVPESNCSCPLDWAFNLQQRGKLRELMDENLGSDFDKVEAEKMINVALVCTNASPSLRPTMSEVVSMLEGTSTIPDAVAVARSYSEDSSKTPKDHHTYEKNQADFSVSTRPWPASSSDIQEVCEVNEESYLMFKAVRDNHMQKSVAQTSTSYPSWTASSSKSSHD